MSERKHYCCAITALVITGIPTFLFGVNVGQHLSALVMKGANMGTFMRYDGYTMHVPQEFIDSKLPVCPFCHSNRPHWLLDSRMEMSLTGHRTYYQCEQCRATMSSTSIDAAAEKGKQFHYNAFVAALNAAQKGSKHQQVGVTYLRVEELGTICTDRSLLGTEYPITFFQEMVQNYDRTHQEPISSVANSPMSGSLSLTTQSVAPEPQHQAPPQVLDNNSIAEDIARFNDKCFHANKRRYIIYYKKSLITRLELCDECAEEIKRLNYEIKPC